MTANNETLTNDYLFTICGNDETLLAGFEIEEALQKDACIAAVDAATDLFECTSQPESDDCFDVETDSNFQAWHGGKFDGSQYLGEHKQRCGFIVVSNGGKISDAVPQELINLAWSMNKALTDVLESLTDVLEA